MATVPLDSASSWLTWSNVVYVGGAVLTLIAAMHVLYEKRAISAGKHKRDYFLSEALVIVAATVSLFGTIGAIHFGNVVSKLKDDDLAQYEKAADIHIADATQKAAAANATAASFEKDIAQANGRAVKAQESLALAEQHSADANAKAEGFRRNIAQANAKAAEANRIAEQERLARLQLEARFADRVISPAQEQSLEAAFARIKGKTVDVAVLGDSIEISQFSEKIMGCMKKAGVLINFSHPLSGSARGVLVGVKADAPPEFKQTADVFIAILQQTVGAGVGHWDFDQPRFQGSISWW